jgi:hypothetical protein
MALLLTGSVLELSRTAAELRAFIDEVRASVEGDPEEFARGIQHEGLYSAGRF